MKNNLKKAILGTLIGDSIGLPMEGLSPRKIQKLGWTKHLKQRFIFSKGMWSDDTDHTLMITEAVLGSGGDVNKFQNLFSRRLRYWFSTLPPGVGLATLRSIIKQFLGFPLDKTGVFSAGNGPSMRAAVLGIIFAHDEEQRKAFNKAQTELTHSDPKALYCSELIVEIAASFVNGQTNLEEVLRTSGGSPHGEWGDLIGKVYRSWKKNVATEDALESFGIKAKKGVSGYSYHTVPAVVFLGLKNDWHFEKTVSEIISLGGDTDTTAAIAGALCALHPESKIPENWKYDLAEWPLTVGHIEEQLQSIEESKPVRFYSWWLWPFYLLRNLFQLLLIFVHVGLRCLPASITRTIIR